MSRTPWSLLLAVGAACLAGCDLTLSVHPLSDEETSIVDARLFGQWDAMPPPDSDDRPQRITIGRHSERPNVIEMVSVEVSDDGEIKVHRTSLYTTKIGDLHCASLLLSEADDAAIRRYYLMLYELNDKGALQFYVLNRNGVIAAIERNELAGTVKRERDDPNIPAAAQPPKYSQVLITAEPKEIAAFIEQGGRNTFAMEPAFTFQKTAAASAEEVQPKSTDEEAPAT